MSDQFSMFDPPTSEGTTSAISLPESAAGPTPSDLPDGPTTAPSGPAPVPVSRFRARASKRAMPTTDTSGPLFTNSSPSADLQRSLENRLRQNLDVNGSPEYALTWKMHDMPSGPPICALRASGRRTSGKGFSGWPTPMSTERTSSPETMAKRLAYRKGNGQNTVPLYLNEVAQTAGWPTPMAGTPAQNGNNAAGNNDSGRKTVELVSGWPTPKEQNSRGASIKRDGLWDIAQTAGWPTPNAISEKRDGLQTNPEAALRRRKQGHMLNLDDAATLATGWATPAATEARQGYQNRDRGKKGTQKSLTTQAIDAFGVVGQSSSPAPTASKGASLNPAFSLWLMGYPTEWAHCAARVTRSRRKSRQPS